MDIEQALKVLRGKVNANLTAKETLKEVEKIIFVMEQVETYDDEQEMMKNQLIEKASSRIPLIKYFIEIEGNRKKHDSTNND
jgi:GTPase Era involved in 16S rRNA processing